MQLVLRRDGARAEMLDMISRRCEKRKRENNLKTKIIVFHPVGSSKIGTDGMSIFYRK